MTAQEIRKAYFDFFVANDHVHIPRAPLVPQNDPTTLFTGSGMQPLIPYLLGQVHPSGNKLVNSQTCIRSQDIDEVGDESHTTFFEMLGNWSLGDYFKAEQIAWFSEFLFDVVGLDPAKVYVSCYVGNKQFSIAEDNEAIEIWKKQFENRGIDAKVVKIGSADQGAIDGMQGGRIFLYDGNENWWSRGGNEENTPIGEPCGPDSEVFYDFGEDLHDSEKWGKPHPASDSPRFMEIGNNVFMAFRRTKEGVEELPSKNIDFGGGLERIAAAAINSHDVYKISLLWPIIESLQELSGKNYEKHMISMRVIADHLRGAIFLAVDGVMPSNNEQGYVVRRLLRRAIRFAFDLGIEQELLKRVVPIVVDMYRNDFPEVASAEASIQEAFEREEKLFRQTLVRGLREFEKEVARATVSQGEGNMKVALRVLTGKALFVLYDTYGFPVELSIEEAKQRSIPLAKNWEEEINKFFEEQRERSRTAGKGVFKGGLADHSVETTRLHTAHHLLLRALKDVLGDHVVQRGSNITAERLRIDFSHPEKVTREQLDEVEKIVNQKIAEDLPMIRSEIAREKAEQLNAEREFGAKYPDTVSVYSLGPKGATVENPMHEKAYSIEFCGGPHVIHTAELAEGSKTFKITKEEASSAGVRRIKAVLV